MVNFILSRHFYDKQRDRLCCPFWYTATDIKIDQAATDTTEIKQLAKVPAELRKLIGSENKVVK